jgi:ankyrin repeat protein
MCRISPLLLGAALILSGCGGSSELASLCAAVDARNVDEVKRLLEAGKFDLNAGQHTIGAGCRPFPHALDNVHSEKLDGDLRGIEIVRLMLDRGADPNGCWYLGSSKTVGISKSRNMCVIEYAVRSQSDGLFKLVLARSAGGDTSLKAPALAAAARDGRIDMVRALAEAGAPLTTALGEAVSAFRFEVVSYLDGKPGAREFKPPREESFAETTFAKAVDGHVQGGLTSSEQAFMTAARRGETALAMAELERGVRVDRLDDYGLSALMRAAAWGHDETVRALLKAGADANLMNGGRTALHLAAQFGRIPVIRTLVGGKARLDPRFSARDPTPLFAAVKAGRSDSVRVLLDLGAESASGDSSLTPLEYAIWLGDTAVVRELVKAGRTPVNVRHPNATESPLHAAIRCRNPDYNVELIQTLIVAGADLKALDKNGNTPLQMLEKKRAGEKLPSYLPCYDAQLAALKEAGG